MLNAMKNLLNVILLLGMVNAFAQNLLASTELEAKNVDKVQIEGKFVDVYVTKGEKVYVKGRIVGNGDEGDYKFETSIVDKTLIVRVEKVRDRNWNSYKISDSRIDLTIRQGVTLAIDNSSGDVHVANLRASKSSISATSGDVTLRSIIANLKVKTSSGDIDIDGLTGDSEIASTSGDQDIYNTRGNIETRASSGDITFSEFEGKIKVQATSGDVKLKKGKGGVKVKTSSGDIDGYEIELNDNAYFDATSGSVTVDFVNHVDDLSFDLTATSGDLEVGNRSGEKRLVIDRGRLTVIGTTSSGDQEYK